MTKLIIKNKFAKSDYDIHSTYECGISLFGWEVKSLRSNNGNLNNSFCSITNKNELWLNNLYIAQYMLVKGDSYRSRKLLMHKREIIKMRTIMDKLSLQILPVSIYWKNNHIKVEIALAKRLKKYDKREKIKELEVKKRIKNIIY
ncbi:SsrA-binding protein [Metamycoplasma salivarium]|uniref:SsrA-binding protein n=2 Tax=Metamycoplasma salivarium TaxID=2124 RepID=A0A448ZXZ5_METSV|nr:SsrA-binding protein SmpB [Metamycoplasma salivarium]CAD7360926.1 SsrA RNA (tmRNA)-binding protein [Metamycoplasma salivarium]VEU56122.1 SsrA RNA (tmRNA)-binding protein [Metamycoplasma salivarium]GIZ05676.1 SsrA-binding protein [Metamycoplasma salivarium]GIZ06236.1 SsrA-binding protein [Metamycoplasma salivarium]GIZ06870.1 SsrA-binding protein [Metamycoplasma salivarium]